MDRRIIELLSQQDIADAISADIIHPQTISFTAISTDSRKIPINSLFVALSGEKFDAHNFIPDVIKSGAKGAIVSKKLDVPDNFTLFVVKDVLIAFGQLAKAILNRRRQFGPLTTYAITGSNGKTSSKELLAALLESKGHHVLKTLGNHNNFVGLPMTVAELSTKHDVAVLEMGTNAPGEIAYLAAIGQPDIAIITNIGPAHLEHFGSLQGVADAKGEMIHTPGLKKIILPTETHEFYDGSIPASVTPVWVGTGEKIYNENVEAFIDKTSFILNDLEADLKFQITLPILGSHNAGNFTRAYAAVRDEHFSKDEIDTATQNIHLPPGRLEYIQAPSGTQFLHDAYNANPASMDQALQWVKTISSPDNRCLILGHMAELGPTAPQLHQTLGRHASQIGASHILCVGDDDIRQGAIDNGFPQQNIKTVNTDNLEEGLKWLSPFITPKTLCLIKGSRSTRLERVLAFFGISSQQPQSH